jgi:hypothetical protein
MTGQATEQPNNGTTKQRNDQTTERRRGKTSPPCRGGGLREGGVKNRRFALPTGNPSIWRRQGTTHLCGIVSSDGISAVAFTRRADWRWGRPGVRGIEPDG